MVNKIINRGKEIITGPQSTILSAATIIMLMIVASRVLGLVRQRALAHFFSASQLGLFFAAFRLPDMIFEVLVFGTFSSAFIPIFTRLVKKDEQDAWRLASSVVNLGVIAFVIIALIILFGAKSLYALIAPGFDPSEQAMVVVLTKYLFLAQGFFIVSYVLTGVLESMRRFLVPALAPLAYNLGIIFGTILLADRFGLYAPVIGVIVGALFHFLIQLPLAVKLGFRFRFSIERNQNLKRLFRLAIPRVVEVSFLQVSKAVELMLASIISTASYTYYTFGNTLQLLPVGLFGTAIAKAALPTLATHAEDKKKFTMTLWRALKEMSFLVIPIATILIVLRIPIVRLVYGTDIFTWESTVQTGLVVSAFAIGVSFQAINALLSRAFYALHDTKTPVIISISTILFVIALDFILVRSFGLDVWALALSFSFGNIISSAFLFYRIQDRLDGQLSFSKFIPFIKYLGAGLASGSVMYFLLKFFDKSVWVKKLSFLTEIDAIRYLPFEKFVLDTRYTVNLLVLTTAVSLVGGLIYLTLCSLMRVEEIKTFSQLVFRVFWGGKLGRVPPQEKEAIVPPPIDTAS